MIHYIGADEDSFFNLHNVTIGL